MTDSVDTEKRLLQQNTHPIVAIVGQENVGKSTLFNCLTQSTQALAANFPGLTHDRKYGIIHLPTSENCTQKTAVLIDTPGLLKAPSGSRKNDQCAQTLSEQSIKQQGKKQTQCAIAEATLIIWVLDAHSQLSSFDQQFSNYLRQQNKPIIVAINKIDRLNTNTVKSDFYALGFPTTLFIATAHRRGIPEMLDTLAAAIINASHPEQKSHEQSKNHAPSENRTTVAIIGRPNSGKSTLINQLIKDNRLLVHATSGTTRDSITVPFHYQGRNYLLVDTAGMRRRRKIEEKIEKLSVLQSIKTIAQAQIIVLLINADDGVTDQDLRLINLVQQRGGSLVIAVNKWDHRTEEQQIHIKKQVSRRLHFLPSITIYYISAKYNQGIHKLLHATQKVIQAIQQPIQTHQLNRILHNATALHPPPKIGNRRIKLRYAHIGSQKPLRIIIHGKQIDRLPMPYQRYLIKQFQHTLELPNTPIQLMLKKDPNPFT